MRYRPLVNVATAVLVLASLPATEHQGHVAGAGDPGPRGREGHRPARPGQYNLTAGYAQAEKNTGHPYNTDTITRFLAATEAGGATTRAPYRHNYTWDGFWPETSPLDLATAGGALTFGNATGWGPNVDWISLARWSWPSRWCRAGDAPGVTAWEGRHTPRRRKR